MNIAFHALPEDEVRSIRRGGLDAYGNPLERHRADEETYPCRHCLGAIPAGGEYLILAHRPFRSDNPYAETGPIFLCAEDCTRPEPAPQVPEILRSPHYIARGYDGMERIVYGTGRVVPTPEIGEYALSLLSNSEIAFVDVRSAANNCFQCRILRS